MGVLLVWSGLASAHPVDGTWVLDGPPTAAVEAIHTGVDRALRSWPSFASGIARVRIAEDNPPCATLLVTVQADRLRWRCGEHPVFERPLEGEITVPTPEGPPVTSVVRIAEDEVRLDWIAEEGRRRDAVRRDGEALALSVTLRSPALPRPVRWTWRYRRGP